MGTIYRKTPKGISEIETRAHRLAPRVRSTLILVDGRRSDSDLSAMIPQGLTESLAALLVDGYIEASAVQEAARPPVAPAPSDGSARSAAASTSHGVRQAGIDLPTLRRDAVHALNEQTGPIGEALAIKMERARTLDELRPLLALAEQIIGNVRSKQAAAEFRTRFSADR